MSDKLTSREQEVCDLVTRGLRDKEVGKVLGISHRTVEDHKLVIYKKFDVHNAVQLTRAVLLPATAT